MTQSMAIQNESRSELHKAIWQHLIARYPSERNYSKPTKFAYRWRDIPEHSLVVVQYISLSSDQVGVFIRGERGVGWGTVEQRLRPFAKQLEKALGNELGTRYFCLNSTRFDVGNRARWDSMADWLHKKANAYQDAVLRIMGSVTLDVTVLTDRFDRALLYATHVHGGQARKGTSIPYVAHLLAVAARVLEYGGSEDMAIAALLHDAVEDQGGEPRISDIRNRFGDRVADTVRSCSDSVINFSAGQPKESWHARKKRYREHLKTVDQETLLVSLSDKVHNARSILRDLRKPDIGTTVWARFKNPKKETLSYYRELANEFCRLLPGQLADELSEIIDVLERE